MPSQEDDRYCFPLFTRRISQSIAWNQNLSNSAWRRRYLGAAHREDIYGRRVTRLKLSDSHKSTNPTFDQNTSIPTFTFQKRYLLSRCSHKHSLSPHWQPPQWHNQPHLHLQLHLPRRQSQRCSVQRRQASWEALSVPMPAKRPVCILPLMSDSHTDFQTVALVCDSSDTSPNDVCAQVCTGPSYPCRKKSAEVPRDLCGRLSSSLPTPFTHILLRFLT